MNDEYLQCYAGAFFMFLLLCLTYTHKFCPTANHIKNSYEKKNYIHEKQQLGIEHWHVCRMNKLQMIEKKNHLDRISRRIFLYFLNLILIVDHFFLSNKLCSFLDILRIFFISHSSFQCVFDVCCKLNCRYITLSHLFFLYS